MLKIKEIDFINTSYDESLSHQIFAIANITFSNYEPINGALLYWKTNEDDHRFTKEDEYKFFYDVTETKYFAAVKFPKHCKLTRDQQQELSYILLEQRGYIGSHSISTNRDAANVLRIRKLFNELTFPAEFNPDHFKMTFNVQFDHEIDELQEIYPFYTKDFIKQYVKWTQLLCEAHFSYIEPYIEHAQMTQICYQNPYLTESFIINHLDKIDWSVLQYNLPVIDRLSRPMRKYLCELLESRDNLQSDLSKNAKKVIEDKDFYAEDRVIYLAADEDEHLVFGPFQFFEYDRGKFKWPGSEHMITKIPSYAKQLYNIYGDKRPTNAEMDKRYKNYTEKQKELFELICEPHWLNRYKNDINWSNVCEWNIHLTDEFIEKHIKYIDFLALAKNTQLSLSNKFIEKYIEKLTMPIITPLLLKHLTRDLYEKYKESIELSSININEYDQTLSLEQLELLEQLLDEE